jgi:lipoteichoic acid synthase
MGEKQDRLSQLSFHRSMSSLRGFFVTINGRLGQAPEKNCLIVQSTMALVIVVIGIKLGKLMFASMGNVGPHPLRTALSVTYASSLVRIAAVVAGGFLVGKVVCPRWKWLVATLPFVAFLVYKVAQALWTGQPIRSYLLERAEVEFRLIPPLVLGAIRIVFSAIRLDVLFLASFAVFVYAVVTLISPKYHRALRILLGTFIGLLLLVSGLELAHYCKTGVTGTGQLLRFFVTNAAGLWPMLRSQIDVLSISALVAPLLVGLAVALLVHRWFARPERGSVPQLTGLFPVVSALLLVTGFIHPVMRDRRFDRLVDNTYLGLKDLAPWRKAGQLEAMKRASQLPLLFDTSKAVLRVRADATATPRNVIIIMLESARASSTSIYDPTLGTTPFLAEFGKRGAVVPEMYSIIPRTSAAWVAVLHGIWPTTDNEMVDWVHAGQLRLRALPALLAGRGYASAFFTTAHLTFFYDAPLIKNMRFQSVYDGDSLPNRGFEHPTFWGFEDRMMLEPSLNWVKQQRDEQRPFLLVMMTNVGHFDYKYPSNWPTKSFGNIDATYSGYLNCLGYIDSVIKDFIAGLEKMGVLRSSIVIILGDHGESFGEHGPRLHASLVYDETVKIPAILYADGVIPHGTSISGLRQQVDIMPTVLDALGLAAEDATLPGASLLQPVPANRPLYFSGALDSEFMAMRRGGLKFIYNFERTPTEAYALDRDPGERHDIAATLPRKVLEEAEMDMLVWRERVSRASFGAQGNH